MSQQNRAEIVTSRITRTSGLLIIVTLCATTLCPLSLSAQEPAPASGVPAPATTTAAPAAAASEPAAPAKRVVDYNNPTLEDILDAWQEREEKVKSFKIVWDEENTLHPLPEGSPLRNSQSASLYPQKVRIQRDRGLSFASAGDKYGLVSFSMHLTEPKIPVIPEWYRSNGTLSGSYYKAADPRYTHGSGSIEKTLTHSEIIRHSIAPVLALYRPLFQVLKSPVLLADASKDLNRYGVAFEFEPSNDGKSRVMVHAVARPHVRHAFVVQSSEGFPVAAIQQESLEEDGRWSVSSLHEITLEPHAVAGVAPKAWRTQLFNSIHGFLEITCSSSMSSLSINETLPDAEFDSLAFPVGTIVDDLRLVEDPGRDIAPRFWQRENGVLEPLDEQVEYEKAEVVRQEDRRIEKHKAKQERQRKMSFFRGDTFLLLQLLAFVVLFAIWYRRRSS